MVANESEALRWVTR